MSLEQSRQAMLQLYLSDQQFYCLQRFDLYLRFGGTGTEKRAIGWNINKPFSTTLEKVLTVINTFD